jgi:hypothetical protein
MAHDPHESSLATVAAGGTDGDTFATAAVGSGATIAVSG